MVEGEATLTLRAGDEANVILAQQCYSRLNGSQQQPLCVVLLNFALGY